MADSLKDMEKKLTKALSRSKKETPWNLEKSQDDIFFPAFSIDGDRWNKIYPYRLMVIDAVNGGIIVNHNATGTGAILNSYGTHGIDRILTQATTGWTINLPITPQQLSITDQFAINTSATMRGIVEEHSGVRFKLITMSGTTGIYPLRSAATGDTRPPAPGLAKSFVAGTIESAKAVASAAKNFASVFTGEEDVLEGTVDKQSTGYFQAHLLAQFLERYSIEKKKPENKNWRLVLDIPKQNQSFIVTPVSFSLQQGQDRPNEIRFSLQLKAWKRIELKSMTVMSLRSISTILGKDTAAPWNLKRILSGVRAARKVISSARNVLTAVRSDVRNVMDGLRQIALAVKDIGGLFISLGDLHNAIVGDIKTSWADTSKILKGSFKKVKHSPAPAPARGSQLPMSTTPGTNSFDAQRGSTIIALKQQSQLNEGLSRQAVEDGALGADAAQSLETSDLNDIFENPDNYYEFLDEINVDDLTLSPQQIQAIEEEIERIQLITIDDMRDIRNEVETLMLDLSNYFGSGDSVFAAIYNRGVPRERAIPLTMEENEILLALSDALQAIDSLIDTKQWDTDKINNSLEYIGGLAEESGIEFSQYTSKFLAPVPFGLTIEQIAARYLNDPDKWVEIATLNNLRSPYIDEIGFSYFLLSNAEGRQFTVNDDEGRIYIGQKIILKSNSIPMFTRKVINLEKISEGNHLVTVDGLDDLDKLTLADKASLQGYLPGTINSQNQIYIPSNDFAEEDSETFDIPTLSADHLTKLSQIDWLLTDNGDLAINSVGDFRLANGLTNLIQALKLKIQTKKGTLLRHLDYGLGLDYGISIADIEDGTILKALNDMVISDSRFSGLERVEYRLSGATLVINMIVNLANQQGILPINFNVNL